MKKQTLEQLCPYAEKCAVDYNMSEICRDKCYVNCIIYQGLIKYKKEFLKKWGVEMSAPLIFLSQGDDEKMTDETCENCGMTKEHHPIRFWNNLILAYEICKKFKAKISEPAKKIKKLMVDMDKKAQNHSPGENYSRLQRGGNTRKVALSKASPSDTKEGNFNLSEKRGEFDDRDKEGFYYEEDVKEFIRILGESSYMISGKYRVVDWDEIKRRAGEELTSWLSLWIY